MGLIMPQALTQAPALFVPKRKPVGPVKIDWSHPIAKGLVYYNVHSSANHTDLVTREPIELASDAYYGNTPYGPAGLNASTSGNFKVNIERPPVTSSAYAFTLLTCIEVTTLAAWGTFLASCYNESTWSSSPYWNLALTRSSSNSTLAFIARYPAGQYEGYGASLTYLTGSEPTLFGASFPAGTGQNVTLHKINSTVGNTTETVTGSAAFDAREWGTLTNWCTFNTGSAGANAGTQGKAYWSGCWGRELTKTEIQSLYNNPYQFLVPA